MHVGVMSFVTDKSIPITELAVEAEARGFESLWVTEKTHVPTSRRTPWPGGPLPDWYRRTYDPFVALAAAGAVTTTLRLGTGVLLVPVRDPVITAKEVASLDHLSGGRVELGVGYGWNAEELATHDVTLAEAPARLVESIDVMTQLWTRGEAAFDGRFTKLEPSWSWPKTIQRPRPPIHIGARATDDVFDDVAGHADGWLPIEGYGDVVSHLPRLRSSFERAGRDPAEVVVSVYSSAGDPTILEGYRAAGITRTVVSLTPTDRDNVLAELDTHAHRLREHIGGSSVR